MALVARRVEAIRGLRFRSVPRPRLVDAEQARSEGLADLDADYPPRRRRADEEILKLLGLLRPADDLRAIESAILGEQTAGYYDTRRERLSVVVDPGADAVERELTLAHELLHALEDQRLGLREPRGTADDAIAAYIALVEGTASVLELEYADRHIGGGDVGSAVSPVEGESRPVTRLPPYVQAAVEFSYLAGGRFVDRLLSETRGWRLVNLALRRRPPQSTEQVIHPEKYLSSERPVPLPLRVGSLLGQGWRPATTGTLGEFDSEQLARVGAPSRAASAAAGWGGGRYELWREGPLPAADCRAPCVRRDVLVLAWTWDTEEDAREFERVVAPYLERALAAQEVAPNRWTARGGHVAFRARGYDSTLAFAPSAALARRLAARALVAPGD